MKSASRLTSPPKLQPGDRVAIVSPSRAGASEFPQVHDIGLRVLREELHLIPVEFKSETVYIEPVPQFTDLQPIGEDPSTLVYSLPTTPEPGWHWHSTTRVVSGPARRISVAY
jgi:hypothetical protein